MINFLVYLLVVLIILGILWRLVVLIVPQGPFKKPAELLSLIGVLPGHHVPHFTLAPPAQPTSLAA